MKKVIESGSCFFILNKQLRSIFWGYKNPSKQIELKQLFLLLLREYKCCS